MASSIYTATSLSSMSVSVDIQALCSRIGADIVIFLVAMLAYLVVHHFKSRSVLSKAACKEALVVLDEQSIDQDSTMSIPTEQVTVAKETSNGKIELQKQCTDATYNLRIQSSRSSEEARAIVNDALDRPAGSVFSFDLVLGILGFCRMSFLDRSLADKLLKLLQEVDVDILSEFIHFYLDTNQFEKACDVFELNFATFFEKELDEDTEWSLMHAALQCGRNSVANHLFETSQADAVRRVSIIQKWWRHSCRSLHENSRETEIGEVFGRLAHVFNERFPFLDNGGQSDSGDESTAFLGDDDSTHDSSDCDSDWNSDYELQTGR